MVRRAAVALVAVFAGMLFIGNGADAQQRTLKSPGKWTPEHPYNITPEAGPWAICIISYTGDTAFSLSEDMVSELRRDFKLPGYFYNRSEAERKEEFDREEALRKQRWEFYRQQGVQDPLKQMVHIKKPLHIEDQYAVMIGGYKDMESARRSLEEMRRFDRFPSARLLHGVMGPDKDGKSSYVPVSPFLTAFVCPNPTVPKPKEPPQAKQEEFETSYRTLQDLNSGEAYSLLRCAGKWTLIVRVYESPTVLQAQHNQGGLFDRAMGNNGGDYMSAAAKQAHQLADILRSKQLKFESYVLHAPKMSMVCVGSFNDEKDPRMAEMANTLCKLRLEPYEKLMQPPKPFPVPKPPAR
ncbi:MAG TPA: hypothetical protein VKS79_25770 [Gemmataceae bacterium]|nr:hypothetical protein [Gemmataceae bacterium]